LTRRELISVNGIFRKWSKLHILRYKIPVFGDAIAEGLRTNTEHHHNKRKETRNSAKVAKVKANHKRRGFNSFSYLLQSLQCLIKSSIGDTLEKAKDSYLGFLARINRILNNHFREVDTQTSHARFQVQNGYRSSY